MLIVLEPEHNVGKLKKIKIQSYMELSCSKSKLQQAQRKYKRTLNKSYKVYGNNL